MIDPVIAWAIVIVGLVAPLIHVAVAAPSAPPASSDNQKCPFSPRAGWIVLVLMLGPIGWAMFMLSRRRRSRTIDKPTS